MDVASKKKPSTKSLALVRAKPRFLEEVDTDLDPSIYLKKHVGLIHCENKLTLIQRKICNILLFNALDEIDKKDLFQITVKRLCCLVGYNSNDISLIKDAIKGLITVIMEWNLLEDGKSALSDKIDEEAVSWNASALLAGVTIKNGLISYSYSHQMKTILSRYDMYGRINLFVQAKFNSTYSLVLYENCIRFKNLKQTTWFPIDLFRTLMGVHGNKYPSFKEFNRNVINVALKEINQKSDICILPKFRKQGRTIVAVQFLLSENENFAPTFKKAPKLTALPPPAEMNLMEMLMEKYYLSERSARAITQNYTRDYILEKIEVLNEKPNLNNPAAYLTSALKKDYKPSKPKPVVVPIAPPVIEQSFQREAVPPFEIVSLKNRYMKYKLEEINQRIKKLAKRKQQKIKTGFEAALKDKKELFTHYKKKGLTSPLMMSAYLKHIEANHEACLEGLLTFEDFITSDEVSA